MQSNGGCTIRIIKRNQSCKHGNQHQHKQTGLNQRHQQQYSIKDELWNDAAPHVQELPEAHEADKCEHNAEDNAYDDIPCDLIVDRDLRRQ